MDDTVLNTRNGMIWIQPDGPNTEVHLLGCHDLGDISAKEGSIELLKCFDKRRGGWKTVGQTQAPPDAVTTSIEQMLYIQRDWLEKLKCDFTLFSLQQAGGPADTFDNYVRAIILNKARVTNWTDKGVAHHDTETPTTQSRDIEAWPPVIRTGLLKARRQETSETLALNSIFSYSALDCNNRIKEGDKVIATADASAYSGNVLQTENAGLDWAALAADPFATGKNIMAGVAFPISATITRLLVAQEATAGQQGKVAYSDDEGATWTVVNIGGGAAGHGAVRAKALYAIDYGHIWLASAEGYIYFSHDGGATWTAQTSGTLTTDDILSVKFQDENYGMAGAENDVLLVTTDGGDTWDLTSAVTGSGDDILSVSPSGNFWWATTSGGEIFYSRDMGEEWSQRGFSGSGVGEVPDLAWANDLVGYMIHNTAAPVGTILVTINGGFTWLPVTTPANSGLNCLSIADTSTVYVAGEVNSGTATIIKLTWD